MGGCCRHSPVLSPTGQEGARLTAQPSWGCSQETRLPSLHTALSAPAWSQHPHL